jgi:hypothetical protein
VVVVDVVVEQAFLYAAGVVPMDSRSPPSSPKASSTVARRNDVGASSPATTTTAAAAHGSTARSGSALNRAPPPLLPPPRLALHGQRMSSFDDAPSAHIVPADTDSKVYIYILATRLITQKLGRVGTRCRQCCRRFRCESVLDQTFRTTSTTVLPR